MKKYRITLFEARTLTWWNSRRDKLDMDPPYQRKGGLWSTTDKAYLIDTILNGFDVPKLYIADFTWGMSPLNEKKLPYAIIDGKQRFEAVFDFFDGHIVLNRDFVYWEDTKLKLGGLGYKDLQNNYKEVSEIFDQYNLSIMTVQAEEEEPIKELFLRLNRSKALTGAEIRNAMLGPVSGIVRNIAKHEFFQTNVRFSITRGQDQNAAAKCLLFEYNEELRETKRRNLDDFVKVAERGEDKRLELSGRRVLDTLSDMASIFLPRDEVLTSSGILPIYYWLIRNVPEDKYAQIRQFLVEFEDARRINRRRREKNPQSKKIDQTLTMYDVYNRSTNDLQSHSGRYNILKKMFDW